jgi:RNA polymerase sigma-70 factor (ECF subfamily)
VFAHLNQREQEFEVTVLCHSQSLLRVARRRTSPPSQIQKGSGAEDLVQDCLLLAWRNFHQFERGTNARAWLFRILFNVFYGQGRKSRRMPEMVSLNAQVRTLPPLLDRDMDLSRTLDMLPVEQRAVLLLAVVEGFTCNEIASILAIPVGTVMSRLSRARQAMRTKLSAKPSPEPAKSYER